MPIRDFFLNERFFDIENAKTSGLTQHAFTDLMILH